MDITAYWMKGINVGGNSTVSIGFINDHADLDLAGRDHMDVDVLAVESFKHGGSRAQGGSAYRHRQC